MESIRIKFSAKKILVNYGFYIIFVLLLIVYSVSTKSFFTIQNFMNMLHDAVPMIIISTGIAMVIISGQIDISVGSIAFLANCIGMVMMMDFGLSIPVSFIITLGAGALLGAVNGIFVVALRMSPLIVTLGTLISFRGVALQLTNSQVTGLPDSLRAFGNYKIGPLFIDVIFGFSVLAVFYFIHLKKPFGRFVTAVGNDEKTAAKIGISVKTIKFLVFMISGGLAGLGGYLSMTQVGAIIPLLGSGAEFTGIAAVIIGGISLFGGEGKILPGVFFGVFLLTVIETGLNQLGVSVYVYPFVRGGIIFIAMYADSLRVSLRS